ncbi:uncharacterized protein LOC132613331 [Lycium barbarum]|uniref:uncharacterized protein LOC132613331 n=1 Tax=Lycium barbarum TaxID=112863 RepID=UPI00293EA1D3|nr:uncharacterized protein LOC132613331 [Lycium barbarum]
MRGLNRQDKQREMNLFLHRSNAGLFGLLETKFKRAKATQAALNLCTGWSFSSNLSHIPGGRIWLMWQHLIFNVNILRTTAQLMQCEVEHTGTRNKFSITVVYGFNDQMLRRDLWQDVEQIQGSVLGAWAVMGDFNCVLKRDERVGRPVTAAEIRDFKRCMGVGYLVELRSSGAFYTWNNKQGDDKRVYSRINRVLVSGAWLTPLPSSEVHFGNDGLIDHCPAMINWDDAIQRAKPRFYYFNIWSQALDFQQKVRENWTQRIEGTKMFQLVGKLNRLKGTLRSINKRHFNEVEIKADKAKAELEDCQTALQQNPTNAYLTRAEIQPAATYHKLHQARIQFFKQKSKLHWLT